jgi:hypothetical protein
LLRGFWEVDDLNNLGIVHEVTTAVFHQMFPTSYSVEFLFIIVPVFLVVTANLTHTDVLVVVLSGA